MSNPTLMPIPQNFRKNVDWILGAYTDAGVTFPNGFQKDAIQNCVGARKSPNNWENWNCDISLKTTSQGLFVVVEDFGTLGLTGRNISGDEVNAMMAREEILPATDVLLASPRCLTPVETPSVKAFSVLVKVYILLHPTTIPITLTRCAKTACMWLMLTHRDRFILLHLKKMKQKHLF